MASTGNLSDYGRWRRSVQVDSGSGTYWATGSNDGVEGLLLGNNNISGSISLYRGGSIALDSLTSDSVYEFSIKNVTVTAGNHIYLLYNRRA